MSAGAGAVSLIDYGVGNLGSVANMLKRCGAQVQLVTTSEQLAASDRVLLPGVGAFDEGVRRLTQNGLDDAVREFALTGRPLLGICLGMQLLLEGSDEGSLPGLGLIPGRSARFDTEGGLRVPHMGWNTVELMRDDPLTADLPPDPRFYFVHSYHAVPDRDEDRLGVTEYGKKFVSIVRSANVMGAQFHPEKSHSFGMQILRNFSSL